MKIKALEIGSVVTIDLQVREATSRRTKPPKNSEYVSFTLFDGEFEIGGNKWNYTSESDGPVPAKGRIICVKGTVGEWQGKKQLTIKGWSDSTMDPAEFLPKGPFCIADYKLKAKELIDMIEPIELQKLVRNIFNDHSELLNTAPGGKFIHHAYVAGCLQHVVDTAIKAKAISDVTEGANVSLCIAGALLHDIGKLHTYFFDNNVIEMTLEGSLFEHIVLGVKIVNSYWSVENANYITIISHIIASHHGKQEYGSPIEPRFLEALIVNYADGIDSKAAMIKEANAKATHSDKYTEKIWAIGNRQMLTQEALKTFLL